MKIQIKGLLTCFFLLISISVWGQQDTIIVGYGETFETIANRYGIKMNELRAANQGKEQCYAGMRIVVPRPYESPVGDSDVTSAVIMYADSLLVAAKDKSAARKYKQAIRIYNKVIAMNVRTPYAYAGRGECHFGLKKYKKAKADLEKAIYSNELAEVEKNWCEEALEDVKDEIRAKRKRRSEAWANVGLAFASAAAYTSAAYMAAEQSRIQNQYYQNNIQSTSYAGPQWSQEAATAQLNQMTQQTLLQAQQTRNRTDQAFKEQIEWMGEFSKRNGRSPNEYEIDQWYAANYPDLLESRILARGKMNSNSDQESESINKKEKTPKGKKLCKACNGEGSFVRNDGSIATYGQSSKKKCPTCGYEYWNGTFHRHENCKYCHGTGYVDY